VSESLGRVGEVPPALGRRINEACNRFEAAWRAGAVPRLEDFVAGWEGAERTALLRELVPLDADYRRGRGENPGADYYAACCPGDATAIRALFAELPSGRQPPRPPTVPADEAPGLWPRAETTGGTAAVPGYEILAELGRGGMGVVYKARHVGLNRVVALKMILAGGHAGPDDLARFRREAEAVARLKHPNVVQIYDIGEAGGLPYFSLEFVEGGSLDRRLAGTPLPPIEAAALMETLARAMAAAHAAGLVHRDLKPANVLLAPDGTPKVTDFGLVKKLGVAIPGQQPAAGVTASGAILGTPSYMAPEQASGRSKEIGPACDIYALGAILYECLTGRPPFRAATPLDTILQVVSEEPVPPRLLNARLPVDLETICLKCLMKEPRRRYATAQELADDLRRFEEGRPIRARPVGTVERALKWVKRRPAAAAAVIGGVLLLFGAGVFLAAAWAGSKEAGEKAAREELDRFRAEVASEREQQQRDEDERTRAQQEVAAGKLCNRQLAKVAVLWNHHPEEALRLLEDARVFPPERRASAWEGYYRLCRMDRQVLQGNGPPLVHLATAADFKTLLTLDTDCTVRLWGWEQATLKVRHTLRLPDDEYERELDRETAELSRMIGLPQLPPARVPMALRGSVSMSADGALLSYPRTTVSFYLPESILKAPLFYQPLAGKVIKAPDSVRAKLKVLTATVDAVNGTVSGKQFDTREHFSTELSKILNKDELQSFQNDVMENLKFEGHHAVVVHEVASNQDRTVREFFDHVLLSPDGKMFAGITTGNGAVWLYDVAAPALKSIIQPGGGRSFNLPVVFAPDGKILAVETGEGGQCKSVQLWDVVSGRRRAEFAGQLRGFRPLAFSPDGMFLAAYSDLPPDLNGKPQAPEVLVWDVPPREQPEQAP